MSTTGLKLLVIGDHQENCAHVSEWLETLEVELTVDQSAGWCNAVPEMEPAAWDAIFVAFRGKSEARAELEMITQAASSNIPIYAFYDCNDPSPDPAPFSVGARRCFASDEWSEMARVIRHDLAMLQERNQLRAELQLTREECRELVRKNAAWRELFDQVNKENRQIKAHVAANVERAILPTIQELKQSPLSRVRRLATLLEQGVAEITSPFLHSLRGTNSSLSPRELEVCHLVRAGLSSKEIAATLRLSPTTVQKHRELIRKKLGIVNLDTNLQVYLQSI